MIRQEDVVSPSAQRQAKLDAVRSVLEYHERSTIVVKILRLGLAWAGMLEGAAVVVSEEAVDILTAEELQAVVAHELGHEYFAAEYEAARQSKQYDGVKEIELRCDAVAVITLRRLRLNPESLMSGVFKLTKFNESRGVKNNPDLVSSLEERVSFNRAMINLIEARGPSRSALETGEGRESPKRPGSRGLVRLIDRWSQTELNRPCRLLRNPTRISAGSAGVLRRAMN